MKIGIFDSGLGGLLITHSILHELPQYEYVYLGDTARVPYGTRSREVIYTFTRQAVDYLFRLDCSLIILACNTASADALRRIQQEYLPVNYPDRRVLGVLIPAAEDAARVTSGTIGVLATQATVQSGAFLREIHKLRPATTIVQQAAPLLVPLIEMDGLKYAVPVIADYLAPLRKAGVDSLILGSTHYPIMRRLIEASMGPDVRIVDQNEIVPAKLKDYLARHPEIESKLSRTEGRSYLVTDLTQAAAAFADRLFGTEIILTPIPAFA